MSAIDRELLRLARGADALVLAVREHEGRRRVDVRIWTRKANGEEAPTGRGVALGASEIDLVVAALRDAQEHLAKLPPASVPPPGRRPDLGREIVARFATTCPTCGECVAPGSTARMVGGVALHPQCVEGA